jgi:hypothetical protein
MIDVEIQCEKPVFTYEDVVSNDSFSFYTGIPNAKVFKALFDEMDDAPQFTTTRGNSDGRTESVGRPRSLRLIDEFFMVLMRLRLGLLLQDLADRFCISKATCGNIFSKWINYLHIKLSFLTFWPSRSVVQKTMPRKFNRCYYRLH